MEVVVRRVPQGGGMPPYRQNGQSGPPMTAALRYALAHPWQSLEHSALVVLFLLYISTVSQKIPCSPGPPERGSAPESSSASASASAEIEQRGPVTHCQLSPPEGPNDAFTEPGVSEASFPTMGDKVASKGQVLTHHDARGDIYRMFVAEGVSANLMWTKKGAMRSGDMHNCTQYDVILRGRTRLRVRNLESGEDIITEFDGNYDFIAIPPRVPHLFEFLEDSFMIEWWACDFHAWYYKPLRDLIDDNMKMAESIKVV